MPTHAHIANVPTVNEEHRSALRSTFHEGELRQANEALPHPLRSAIEYTHNLQHVRSPKPTYSATESSSPRGVNLRFLTEMMQRQTESVCEREGARERRGTMGAERLGQTHPMTHSHTHSQYPRAPTAHYSAGSPALYSPNRPHPWSAGREWGKPPAPAPAPPVYRTTARYYRDPVPGSVGPQQTTTPKRNQYNGHTLQVAGMVLIRNSQNEIMVASILSNCSAFQDGNILVMSLSSRATLLCVHTHGVCARALSNLLSTIIPCLVRVFRWGIFWKVSMEGLLATSPSSRLRVSPPPSLRTSFPPSLPSSLTSHTLSHIHAHAHTQTHTHSHSLYARSYREWKSFDARRDLSGDPPVHKSIPVYFPVSSFLSYKPKQVGHAHTVTNPQHTHNTHVDVCRLSNTSCKLELAPTSHSASLAMYSLSVCMLACSRARMRWEGATACTYACLSLPGPRVIHAF